jgi:hypothetical protein
MLRFSALALVFVLGIAAPLCSMAQAQSPKTITILMLDGKTGKPLAPNNYIVRLDHKNAIHNEALRVNDEGLGTLTVPGDASFLAVQGTYHDSLDVYINCDAGMEKDTSTLHWYSIADIMNSGVVAPNECYKGKYAETAAVAAKPGVFVFYVREISWRDTHAD